MNDHSWPSPAVQAMKSIRRRPTAACDPCRSFELITPMSGFGMSQVKIAFDRGMSSVSQYLEVGPPTRFDVSSDRIPGRADSVFSVEDRDSFIHSRYSNTIPRHYVCSIGRDHTKKRVVGTRRK